MSALRLLGLAGIVLCSLGRAALADDPRSVAVLRVEFEGRVPDMAKVNLQQRLFEGLAAAGFQVTAGEVVRGALKKGAETCRDEVCYRQAAAALHVNNLVTAAVSARQRNYEIKVELISGQTGKPVGEARDRCELCGLEEVGAKLGRAVASLPVPEAPRAQAAVRLVLGSRPDGVQVSLDGRPAGATPVELILGPGPHEVALVSPPGGGPGDEGQRRLRWVGWGSLGAAVALLAGGAVSLALDGREKTCSAAAPPGARCSMDTQVVSAGLLASGAAAAVSGGLVLFFTRGTGASASPAGGKTTAWLGVRRTF